jgi:hypothetical protein
MTEIHGAFPNDLQAILISSFSNAANTSMSAFEEHPLHLRATCVLRLRRYGVAATRVMSRDY